MFHGRLIIGWSIFGSLVGGPGVDHVLMIVRAPIGRPFVDSLFYHRLAIGSLFDWLCRVHWLRHDLLVIDRLFGPVLVSSFGHWSVIDSLVGGPWCGHICVGG